ncbi:MAG: malonate decarboxylase holo-[acyl-carrier-protein] synthase [Caldimonas sp.]
MADATALRRHRLVWLTAPGWARALGGGWDEEARGCMAHWADRRLPLVVTRQSLPAVAGSVALGLPAPAGFGRRRLALAVGHDEIETCGEFPSLASLSAALDGSAHGPCHRLNAALAMCGSRPRVYGSRGWQALTGLDHVHECSDLDLLLPVADAAVADAVCEALQAVPDCLPRLDGELVFHHDVAVAWREWQRWREDDERVRILVKRTDGVALEEGDAWHLAATIDAANDAVKVPAQAEAHAEVDVDARAAMGAVLAGEAIPVCARAAA